MDLKKPQPKKIIKTPKSVLKQKPETLANYSFAEHYGALRSAVLWSALSYLCGIVIAYYYATDSYRLLSKPLFEALVSHHGDTIMLHRFIYTGISEAFFTYMDLAFYLGFVIAFPFIAYQIYSFFAPALYKNERRLLAPYLFAAPILFIFGGLFA